MSDPAALSASPSVIEVFYDGDCPLCRREIGMLRWLDRKQRICFTDISAKEFDPTIVERSQDELMAEIHGRLPDGEIVVGVEVLRRLYAAVGFGWLVAVTRLPGISHLLGFAYRVFARNRLKWTRRQAASCPTSPSRDATAAPQ